jgi:hypothetical protein
MEPGHAVRPAEQEAHAARIADDVDAISAQSRMSNSSARGREL